MIIASRILSYLSLRKLVAFVIIGMLLFLPLYDRYLQPALTLEDGIREVTRDMAHYIDSNIGKDETIYCTFNCPSLAYYMDQKTEWYTENFVGDYVVIFDESKNLSDYSIIYSSYNKSRAAFLLMRNE